MLNLDGPAWAFALDFYRRPGIAPACLTLQDQAGVDVIHLILVLYSYIVPNRSLSAETIHAARAAMAGWREATVLPIRENRRAMKRATTAFPQEQEIVRTRIKEAELLAEQMQLAMAEHWLQDEPAAEGLSLEAALQAVVACYDEHPTEYRNEAEAALGVIADAAERMRASISCSHLPRV